MVKDGHTPFLGRLRAKNLSRYGYAWNISDSRELADSLSRINRKGIPHASSKTPARRP
jgi:hypothetical protein